MALKAYLASPYGFTESTRHFMAKVLVPRLSAVVEIVNPWDLTTAEEIAEARRSGTQRELGMTVGRRNQRAIEASELVIAALDGQEVDSGTAAEVGFAAGLGKTIFGYRGDLRRSGEDGFAVNLQLEYFIVASGGTIATGLSELEELLRRHRR